MLHLLHSHSIPPPKMLWVYRLVCSAISAISAEQEHWEEVHHWYLRGHDGVGPNIFLKLWNILNVLNCVSGEPHEQILLVKCTNIEAHTFHLVVLFLFPSVTFTSSPFPSSSSPSPCNPSLLEHWSVFLLCSYCRADLSTPLYAIVWRFLHFMDNYITLWDLLVHQHHHHHHCLWIIHDDLQGLLFNLKEWPE